MNWLEFEPRTPSIAVRCSSHWATDRLRVVTVQAKAPIGKACYVTSRKVNKKIPLWVWLSHFWYHPNWLWSNYDRHLRLAFWSWANQLILNIFGWNNLYLFPALHMDHPIFCQSILFRLTTFGWLRVWATLTYGLHLPNSETVASHIDRVTPPVPCISSSSKHYFNDYLCLLYQSFTHGRGPRQLETRWSQLKTALRQ